MGAISNYILGMHAASMLPFINSEIPTCSDVLVLQ